MKPHCFEQLLDCAFVLFLYLPRVSPEVTHILSLRDMALEAANVNNPVRSGGINPLKGNRPAKYADRSQVVFPDEI